MIKKKFLVMFLVSTVNFGFVGCLPGLLGGVHQADPNEISDVQRAEQALNHQPVVEFSPTAQQLPAADLLKSQLLALQQNPTAERHFVLQKDGRSIGRLSMATTPGPTPPDRLLVSAYEAQSQIATVKFVHDSDKVTIDVIESWHFDGKIWSPVNANAK